MGAWPERVAALNAYFETYRSGDEYDRILALTDAAIAERVDAFRAEQAGRAELRIDPRA